MPTTPGCQPSPAAQASAGSPRARLGRRLVAKPRLDRAAVAVEIVELRRHARRLGRVGAGQAAGAEVGPPHAPARVDAGAEQEAEVERRRQRVEPRDVGQRDQARPLPPCHDRKPLPHEGAVDADQRRHVRDRRQRHEVEMRDQVRLGPAGRAQDAVALDQRQEHDARRAQVAERAVLVRAVGVHHRERGRQRLAALVMIQHDHVGAAFRGRERIVAERAAVHAHDQVVSGCEGRDGGGVGAVAFVDAVGDIKRGVAPERAQPADQQRGRGAAVHVVVGEDGDALAAQRRRDDAFGGGPHVAQAQRVGEKVAQARLQVARGGVVVDAALGQHARDRQGQGGKLGQPLGPAFEVGGGADPAAAAQRARDAEERPRRGIIEGHGVTCGSRAALARAGHPDGRSEAPGRREGRPGGKIRPA